MLNKMNAIDFLKEESKLYGGFHSTEGDKLHRPSVSELKRWLEKGSVIINGVRPKPNDEIKYPITELVLFPGSKNRNFLWMTDEAWEGRKFVYYPELK